MSDSFRGGLPSEGAAGQGVDELRRRLALGMLVATPVSFAGAAAARGAPQDAAHGITAGADHGDVLNVRDFGMKPDVSAEQNARALGAAIAAANRDNRLLYVPAGRYRTTGKPVPLTGPGIVGAGAGLAIIEHHSPDSCFVTKGNYKLVSDLTIINRSPPGKGKADQACLKIVNCAYGRFTNIYTAHDLDDYAGIMLLQEHDGSTEDAAFLTHLGCWYNYFLNCSANYASFAGARGRGIHFCVSDSAVAASNPMGQRSGVYTGQCSYNIIDLPNIEQRSEGLRLERSVGNQVRGGQFLGSTTQVSLIDSSANIFIGTKHNQWTETIFRERGSSGRNIILYPVLSGLGRQPWSIGELSASSSVLRGDEKGSWTPHLMFGRTPAAVSRAVGSYRKIDNQVEVNWDIRLAAAPAAGRMEIGGLPFPAINDPSLGMAVCNILILDSGNSPEKTPGKIAMGFCASSIVTGISDHKEDLYGNHFDRGAIILGKMTYFT